MPPGRVNASPQKGTPQRVMTPSLNSSSVKASDPPALVCTPGGLREYSFFAGDSEGRKGRQAPAASPATTAAMPASATRFLPENMNNLRIDDVKPVIAHTPAGKPAAPVASQQRRAGGGTSAIRTSPSLPRIRNPPVLETVNPAELGGAYHQKKVLERWRKEAAERGDDGLSSSDNEETDDEILSGKAFQRRAAWPAPVNKATEQPKTGNDTSASTNTPAGTKQTPDSSKSEIWRYLMTLTKSEIPVPDDPAIMELLTLAQQRDLSKPWQRRLSKFESFELNTLTELILYVGGDEAPSTPCERMGCSAHPEAHVFPRLNFVYGSCFDHRFPFPKCVFLPDHLRNSVSITERLGGHLCCNAYHRSWKKAPYWARKLPNDTLEVARDAAGMGVKNQLLGANRVGAHSNTNISASTPTAVMQSSRTGNNVVQPSSSQATPQGSSSRQLANTVLNTNTPQGSPKKAIPRSSVKENTESAFQLESSPVNPNVGKKRKKQDVEEKEKKKKRKSKHEQEEQRPVKEQSPSKQAHATPVSSATASLVGLTVDDASTTPHRSPEKDTQGQSKNGGVLNVATDRPESLGLKGDDSKLLQASKKQSLECKVWAGSVRVKPIGAGSIGDGYRVSAGGTFTVNPDSLCLVSNFFPETEETAVVGIKSKPVVEISE
ncbi:hypothetical protein B0T20DRAFT_485046 [Sordaria brevicollis]|uniref:Uncharacterized protein n=1 Tax=Sordaria brevicollis TaxID=83679 RepID=A0AAE0UFP8_SORBR|nr:hypothetical protein B0T20DRAFT_485046 [Sordaria brevicollis]